MRSRRKKIRENSKKIKRKNYSKQATNSKMDPFVNNPYWIIDFKHKEREKLTKKVIKKRKAPKEGRKKQQTNR